MKEKRSLLFLSVVILVFIGCAGYPNHKRSKIFVVQEVQLNNGRSLFWFKDGEDDSHGSVSYFQITQDPCELSVNRAHAKCNSPVQINDYLGDTIFILSHEPLLLLRSDSWVSLKAINFSPQLYDSNKNPAAGRQFFLDSLCPRE